MTDIDIEKATGDLSGAISRSQTFRQEHKALLAAGLDVVRIVLTDLRRVADASERIATTLERDDPNVRHR